MDGSRAVEGPIKRIWLPVVISGLIAVTQLPVFLAYLWPPARIISDFYQDWASARNAWTGRPIYAPHKDTLSRFIDEPDPVLLCNEINAHPPTSVLLMMPFAGVAYHRALLAWNVVSLLMLGLSLWVIWRMLAVPSSLRSILLAACLVLLCQPLRMQFFQGQWNLVLLPLLTGVWAADRADRPGWAGALLGAATAIKLFPGFLFLYFAVRHRWLALLAGAMTLIALAVLTAAVLGPDVYPTYYRDVLPRLEKFRGSWFNASLVGFWTRLFNPATTDGGRVEPLWRSAAAARGGILVSWLAVVAGVAWVVRRARSRADLDHAYWLAVTAALLVSPITWDHAFLLLPAAAITTYFRLPPTRSASYLLILILAVLWMWPVTIPSAIIPGGHAQGVAGPVLALTVLSCQNYALLGLFILGLWVARNRTRTEEVSP